MLGGRGLRTLTWEEMDAGRPEAEDRMPGGKLMAQVEGKQMALPWPAANAVDEAEDSLT